MTTNPRTFDEFEKAKFFSCFDGIRAFAVLAVVAYHCPSLGIEFVDTVRSAGDMGVDLFFVISGFLITTLLLREKPAPLGSRLKRFYIRRSLRIFPLYYAAIGVYWLLGVLVARDRLDRYEEFIPSLLLYYSDYRLAFDPNPFPLFGQSWSLAVEEKYYLLWPIVVMVLSERRAMIVCVSCIVMAIAARMGLALTYEGDLTARLYYAFETRFDAIMWGSLLAFLLRIPAAFAFLSRVLTAPVLIALVLGFLVYGPTASNASQLRYVLVPVISAGILATYLIRPTALGSGLLNVRPVAYIGRVSYGVYVLHPIGVAMVMRLIPGESTGARIAVLILGAVMSVAIAALSFTLFESWFLRLKSRFR